MVGYNKKANVTVPLMKEGRLATFAVNQTNPSP